MTNVATLLRGTVVMILLAGPAIAQSSLTEVSQETNKKLVKLFGSGGYKGLVAYGTGILISPHGHILTVANHILDTPDLRVHLYDGRKYRAKVIVMEPELDAAILKIDSGKGEKPEEPNDLDLPYFDFAEAAKRPLAQPGDWVLGFSNQFEIATRDEPMSVTRGVIASYTKLHGRRGIFEATYTGDVYVLDAITNNPGAAGGALTTRDGVLLGMIGRELRNTLSETWLNYAIPIRAQITLKLPENKTETLSLPVFVEKGLSNTYKPTTREKPTAGPGGYHGIVMVPNVVERTPPFVEDVIPESPGQKAGLKPDDLIVYVDGEPISSIKAFEEFIGKTTPGMTIKLEVRRGDKLMTVDLKLDERPRRKP